MAFPQHQTQTRRPCHFKGLTKKHVLPLAEICSSEFTSSQVVVGPSRFSRVGLAFTSFEIWLFSTIFGLFQSLRCLGFAGLIGRTWKNIFSLKREKFYLQKIKVIKIQSRFSRVCKIWSQKKNHNILAPKKDENYYPFLCAFDY